MRASVGSSRSAVASGEGFACKVGPISRPELTLRAGRDVNVNIAEARLTNWAPSMLSLV